MNTSFFSKIKRRVLSDLGFDSAPHLRPAFDNVRRFVSILRANGSPADICFEFKQTPEIEEKSCRLLRALILRQKARLDLDAADEELALAMKELDKAVASSVNGNLPCGSHVILELGAVCRVSHATIFARHWGKIILAAGAVVAGESAEFPAEFDGKEALPEDIRKYLAINPDTGRAVLERATSDYAFAKAIAEQEDKLPRCVWWLADLFVKLHKCDKLPSDLFWLNAPTTRPNQ